MQNNISKLSRSVCFRSVSKPYRKNWNHRWWWLNKEKKRFYFDVDKGKRWLFIPKQWSYVFFLFIKSIFNVNFFLFQTFMKTKWLLLIFLKYFIGLIMCNLWVNIYVFSVRVLWHQNVLVLFLFFRQFYCCFGFFLLYLFDLYYITSNTNPNREKLCEKKAKWYWSNRMCCCLIFTYIIWCCKLHIFNTYTNTHFYVVIVFPPLWFSNLPYTFRTVRFIRIFFMCFNQLSCKLVILNNISVAIL